MSSGVVRVRDWYFWAISGIYLCAFSSLYTQLPGLYGDDGVLPVRAFAQVDKRGVSALLTAFQRIPSAIWLGPSIGLSLNTTLELVVVTGLLISFLQLIFPSFRDASMYLILWCAYFSLYQIGQTFLSFQWDILLLETGFLTILASSFHLPFVPTQGPHDSIVFWLFRWLLFRLMFSSGIVKLTSRCPTWWGLTALTIHFESQCIPHAASWYAHHLPHWILKLAVVSTYVIEIAIPFLFFVPIRQLRLFAFWSQIIFQLAIIATGNYNFFNLLTIALTLTILNDSHLIGKDSSVKGMRMPRWIKEMLTYLVYFGLLYWTIILFDFKFTKGVISCRIAFEYADLQRFLGLAIPVGIGIGIVSLAMTILTAIYRSLTLESTNFQTVNRVRHLLMTAIFSCVAIYMFSISLVPLVSLDAPQQSATIWPIIHRWHKSASGLPIVNSYGLFRRMTGVNGRPELVIEGSNDLTTGWKEYHFMYKPGDVSQAPKFIVPHQPRLDWQIWFAALDHHQNHPWLHFLSYRLLTGQPEVLELLDSSRLPFQSPPKYIRARLYTYQFTGLNAKNWWKRSDVKDYMPPASKESLKDFLSQNGIEQQKKVSLDDRFPLLVDALKWLRRTTSKLSPTNFIYALFVTALAVGHR